jgi:hypothetical protein
MFAGAGINFNQKPSSQLDKIIDLALGEIEPDGTCRTTTVALHLAQMREWGIRGGNIQIKPIQDFNDIRKDYIYRLTTENGIKQRLDSCMDRMVSKGEILWVAYPSEVMEAGYTIDYFVGGKHNSNPQFHVFYSKQNKHEIECVVTKSAIEADYDLMMGNAVNISGQPMQKWELTFIDKFNYISFTFNQEPINLRSCYYIYEYLKGNGSYAPFNIAQPPVVQSNVFAPDFPFQVCKNKFIELNKPGIDDFHPIADLIEGHNDLLLDADENLATFTSPTMITSRNAESVVEELGMNEDKGFSNSWASQNGFYSALNRKKPRSRFKVPKVIGSLKADERFGYIQQPDTISGDHNLFIRQERELIHWTLGGVDPLGISASATFGEIKSLFGRIENTAMGKADALIGEKGLCKLISKILLAEERKCKIAIGNFILSQYLQGSQIAAEMIQRELTDDLFRNLYFHITNDLGLELPGLPPLGQKDCSWRYTKDVFQRTTQEMQQASIVYRNMREDGISQEVALPELYPNKRDDEIRNSMSGFSPRVVTNAVNAVGGALQLYMQFQQIPYPQNPQISWAQAMGLDKIVEQGLLTLQKEINYGIPEFKEEPNPDEVNSALNESLQRLRQNVPTSNTIPITSLPGSTKSTAIRSD